MELLLWLGGGAAALLALGALARGAWRATRRIVHISEAVSELSPNGGSSLKDQVTQLVAGMAALTKRMDDHLAEHEREKAI